MATSETEGQEPDIENITEIMQSVIVQRVGGSYQVTVPSEVADDLDIEKGDRVVFRATNDGSDVSFGKIDDVF
jgi:AbrB family looped-hinge helix DNA binding protein